jgi:N4-gp56 family major capsid protein
MSTTTFTSASALAVKVWARKVFNDAVKTTLYGKLSGTSDRAIVQVKDELKKGEGDRVRFQLRSLPTGIGVQDDETLEGKEEGLDFRYFDLNLGEKRHAIKVDLNLSAQRTIFDVRSEAKAALEEWIEDYCDTTFFEYLAGLGVGAAGASKYHPSGALGGNAITAPASDRIVYPGAVTAHNNLLVTDVMSLAVLDKVAERIKRASPTMRPGSFDGKNLYVCIMSPEQVNDVRSTTSAGQWFDIQKAAMMGGKVSDNPIFGESLGVYRNLLLIESTRIPTFTDGGAGANIKGARAVVLGAQAAVAAYGNGTDDKGRLKATDRTFDYGKRYGVSATLIWGMAKTVFNGQSDFGVFTVETAAAPH